LLFFVAASAVELIKQSDKMKKDRLRINYSKALDDATDKESGQDNRIGWIDRIKTQRATSCCF
jgi:hypothetical protein